MTCRTEGCEAPKYSSYAVCRVHHNERRRRKYHGDPTGKDRTLRFKYGITQAERDAMLVVQGGCAICGATEHGGRDWCVDHDHNCCPGKKSCGKCIRGVLCFGCNVGLGAFRDDADRMALAIAYLKQEIHHGSEQRSAVR